MTVDQGKQLQVGDRITNLQGVNAIWYVRQIVQRGIVVSFKKVGDHEHLKEWHELWRYDKFP